MLSVGKGLGVTCYNSIEINLLPMNHVIPSVEHKPFLIWPSNHKPWDLHLTLKGLVTEVQNNMASESEYTQFFFYLFDCFI